MNTTLKELIERKLILVTGKGGIGKTTVSALFALQAATQGKKTLLVEFAAHDQIAPAFGMRPCGHVETSVLPKLSIINLNARDNFREYIVKYLGLGSMFEKVFAHHVITSFIETIPGIAELMLLGRLFYSAQLRKDDPFDVVVFDGPASGHFLNLMTTPQAVADAGLVGPVRTEADRIREFLGDPKCTALVAVSTADELAVSESLEFIPKLVATSPAKPSLIVMNRSLPQSVSADLESLPPKAKLYFIERQQREQEALRMLHKGFEHFAIPMMGVQDRGALPVPLSTEWAAKIAKEELWSL